MASSTRGGAALQNEVDLLKQQLVHAKELTAAKNGELAEGELQSLRLLAASQAQQLARQADVPEAETGEHAKKRARLADSSHTPLDDDEILDTVFSYVGIGDYIYTGAVSRRWKGRYTKLCHNEAKEGKKDKLTTAHQSTVMTAARLQLALKSSLSVADLQRNTMLHSYIVVLSLEPIAVLALAKTRDFQWRRHLARVTAHYGKLELLQWLHECGCPWVESDVCRRAALSGNVDMLNWLQQVTAPWSDELKREMLFSAGWNNQLAAAQWLRQQSADWPSCFYGTAVVRKEEVKVCWTVRVVRWALNNGCTWGEWQCDQLQPALYSGEYYAWQAERLFDWAHKNGCPCTCDADSS
eukprot:5383-Heterococcus_DN1.PRE.3